MELRVSISARRAYTQKIGDLRLKLVILYIQVIRPGDIKHILSIQVRQARRLGSCQRTEASRAGAKCGRDTRSPAFLIGCSRSEEEGQGKSADREDNSSQIPEMGLGGARKADKSGGYGVPLCAKTHSGTLGLNLAPHG